MINTFPTKNITRELDCKVLDRTNLYPWYFCTARVETSYARTQVELATMSIFITSA